MDAENMTDEELQFQAGCSALYLEVDKSIAEDVRSLGTKAIQAATAAERKRCAEIAQKYERSPETHVANLIAAAIENPET